MVLIDLDLPGWTGLKIISHLRAMHPDMAIIALNLLDISSYRQAALEAGADDLVVKANLGADLLPAIRRFIQIDRPGRSQISRYFIGTLSPPKAMREEENG